MEYTKTRAAAALRLLRSCQTGGDLDGFDLIFSVLADEALYAHLENDDGLPYSSMAEFAAVMDAELAEPADGSRPDAAASGNNRFLEIIAELEGHVAAAKAARGV